jgi:peptidylamidoglycolate lyase
VEIIAVSIASVIEFHGGAVMRRYPVVFSLFLMAGVLLGQHLFTSDSAPSPYQVVHGWPQLPEGFSFGQVSGIGVDSHNHVFVFHRGKQHSLMMFDGSTGKLLKSFGEGMFAGTHGLKIDDHDNIWLTDVALNQVFKFSHDGELLMTVGAKNVPGWDGKHFDKPTDIAIAPNGDFYVSDGYGNSRVAKFDAKGNFLMDWGTKGSEPGQFNLPHGIALDPQGRVYVADRANSRIQVFDANGKFITLWKSAELGRPWNIRFHNGFLYVVDGGDVIHPSLWPYRTAIMKLDLTGKVVEKWGRWGKYDGMLYWPHCIDIAPNGDIYIGDVDQGMRAQKFVRIAN